VLVEEYKVPPPSSNKRSVRRKRLTSTNCRAPSGEPLRPSSVASNTDRAAAPVLADVLNGMYRWFTPSGRLSEKQISRYNSELFVYSVLGPRGSDTRRHQLTRGRRRIRSAITLRRIVEVPPITVYAGA
jgi:hypothetical protein